MHLSPAKHFEQLANSVYICKTY